MQKKNSCKTLFTLALVLISTSIFAEDLALRGEIARAAARATLEQRSASYEVPVSLVWKKSVTMQDVMARRPRVRGFNRQILYIREKSSSCLGVLVGAGDKILMPATCLDEKDYQLKEIVFHLQNGKTAVSSKEDIRIKGEIASVAVEAQLTQGLEKLPVSFTTQGRSLQEVYGLSMTDHLHAFFRAHHVPFKRPARRRTARHLYSKRPTYLRVGEPLIYQGRLVALVKEPITHYGNIWGEVSEESLAVIVY